MTDDERDDGGDILKRLGDQHEDQPGDLGKTTTGAASNGAADASGPVDGPPPVPAS